MKWVDGEKEYKLLVRDDFLSRSEIAVIQAAAKSAFDKGEFETSTTEDGINKKDRDSMSTDVSLSDNTRLALIVHKIMGEIGYDIRQCEPQLCQYSKGGKFLLHHDTVGLDLGTMQLDPIEETSYRIVTVIVYLDDCDGGATHFPNLGAEGFALSRKEVLYGPGEGGVCVEPRQGRIVIFKNVRSGDGTADIDTVHEAQELKSNQKRILQIWVRNKPFTGGAEADSDSGEGDDDEDWSSGNSGKRQKTVREK